MCKPDNLNIFLKTDNFANECTLSAKWFGTKYSVNKFTPSLKGKMIWQDVDIF